jgi:hypothetical protein
MFILVPWKPVALVLGLLGALIFVSYFGSALMHGKDPFAVSTGNWQRSTAQHAESQSTPAHKPAPKAPVRVLSRMFRGKLLVFSARATDTTSYASPAGWLNSPRHARFTRCSIRCDVKSGWSIPNLPSADPNTC